MEQLDMAMWRLWLREAGARYNRYVRCTHAHTYNSELCSLRIPLPRAPASPQVFTAPLPATAINPKMTLEEGTPTLAVFYVHVSCQAGQKQS